METLGNTSLFLQGYESIRLHNGNYPKLFIRFRRIAILYIWYPIPCISDIVGGEEDNPRD